MKFLLLSFLAGLVAALGFEPLGIWVATLVGFVGLLRLVEQAPSLRSALARGWWFGVGHFVLGLNWIATAFTYQSAMPAWLGWVSVGLLSLYLAVYPAMAAGLAWRHGRVNRTAFVLIYAASWIVTEWLRATVFTGFAWNPAGVTLIDTPLAQVAPWIGTYGVSGLLVVRLCREATCRSASFSPISASRTSGSRASRGATSRSSSGCRGRRRPLQGSCCGPRRR